MDVRRERFEHLYSLIFRSKPCYRIRASRQRGRVHHFSQPLASMPQYLMTVGLRNRKKIPLLGSAGKVESPETAPLVVVQRHFGALPSPAFSSPLGREGQVHPRLP